MQNTILRRSVLVAGGAGFVGEAIVRALCASPIVGDIFVSSRSELRLSELRRRLGERSARTTTMMGDAGDPDDAARLVAAAVEHSGRLDVAIASLGAGKPHGRKFVDVDPGSYMKLMHEMLSTHVAFARAVLPQLAQGGAYIGIGGGAALSPMPGGSIISIAAAGQLMMTRVLEAERARADVSIRELVINGPVPAAGEPLARGAICANQVGIVVEELLRTGATTWPHLRVDGPIFTMYPRNASAASSAN